MELDDVIGKLIAILKEIQAEVSEGGEVEEIDINTRPIGGLRHFDSLLGELVTVRCFAQFDIKDDGKTISLLTPKKGDEALTVGEIADRILALRR